MDVDCQDLVADGNCVVFFLVCFVWETDMLEKKHFLSVSLTI